MKKLFCLLLAVCVLLPCLAGCSSGGQTQNIIQEDTPRTFSTVEEMARYIEGVWSVENSGKICYYIFQNGKAYYTDRESFESKVSLYADSLETRTGNEIISAMNYQTFLNTGEVRTPLANVTLEPDAGTVYINKGQKFEKRLTFFSDKALIKESFVEYDVDLTRVSEKSDLSDAWFADTYKKKISDITITMRELVSPKEYLDEVISYYQDTKDWKLYNEDDTSVWYTSNGKKDYNNGEYVLTDNSLVYSRGYNYLGGDDKYETTILYTANTGELVITNNDGMGLFVTLHRAEPLLSAYPGALDVGELSKRFSEEKQMSYGMYYYHETINGIEYLFQEDQDYETCFIIIKFPGEINFAEYLKAIEEENVTLPEETEPEGIWETTDSWESETVPETTAPVLEIKANSNCTWYMIDLDMDLDRLYEMYYAFAEDGTCYTVTRAGQEIIAKGVGTYTVENNTVRITAGGKTIVYDIDIEKRLCTVVSEQGPLAWWETGTKCGFNFLEDEMGSAWALTREEIIEKAKA